MMVRSLRCLAAALLLSSAGASAWAQRPLILTTPAAAPPAPPAAATFASPEPTPAGLPPAPPPGTSLPPAVGEEIPMPAASGPVPVPMISPAPAAPALPAPQAACCGASAAVAACCPASPARCAPAPAPVATCGCAVGGAASFAAFAPAALYSGGPNASCCGGPGSGGGSMGLIDNARFYGIGGYGTTAYGSPYGLPGQVVAFPNISPNALYAGGYANGGYGAAVSGAWPTHYGDFAGASAASGFPMGIASGGTAGEHIRNPYYNDRRPWYSPGPGARTVSIVW